MNVQAWRTLLQPELGGVIQPPIPGSCPLLSRALNDRGLRLHGRGLPLSLGLEQHAVGRQQRLDVLKVHALQRRGRR